MKPEELRAKMKAQPFAPNGLSAELRIASALEYTAYYLGEIEGHLGKIAAEPEPTSNLSRIASAVQSIAHMLPTLAKR